MLLIYLTAAWTLGILLARYFWSQGIIGCHAPALWIWGTLSAILIVSAIVLRRRKNVRLTLVLILFAILGAWRYQSHPPDPCLTPSDLAFHNGNEDKFVWATVEGIVDDYPNVRDRTTSYTLRVHTLELDGMRQEVEGSLLLRTSRYPEYEYGDELRISGLLQTPLDYANFSYREYLARQGVHSLIDYPGQVELLARDQGSRFWSALYSLRSRLSDAINRILPEPQASLLN
ncbi:MAG TPA: ComEC/Rec2 family competence protein, partial [Anaerolineae bacterium]|nr:ComEC/Rec2 family competence protein [Anaerolineae bacterium]